MCVCVCLVLHVEERVRVFGGRGRRSGNGGGFRERKWWKLEERERVNGSELILEGGLCEIEVFFFSEEKTLFEDGGERERREGAR